MDNKTIIIDKLRKDQEFRVSDGEIKTFVIFLLDREDQIGKVRIIIKGSKAYVRIFGVIIGSNTQQINLYTLQDHQKPESISDLLIKTVLFDEAKFQYQGLIKIEKGAQKSNAYQKNQNLMMSEKAWADSRPYLEILANDVRCTHGATIGRLDKEQVYYLASRGLGRKEASRLLIEGFLNEVISRISDKIIQASLMDKISLAINRLTKHKQLS